MDKDKIRQIHTVRICDGSGVLVKPFATDYLYILTDYHVIKDKHIEEITFMFEKGSPLIDLSPEIIEIVYKEQLDVSIIKIRNIHCKEIEYLRTKTKNIGNNLFHIGFPKCRYDDKAVCRTSVININYNDGAAGGHLVEYECEKPTKKEEIEGMSGGGIFDSEYHLVGLHKQSSNLDKYELLGKAAYIPICDFKKVIAEYKWAPIIEFDLDSFASFSAMAFNFEGQSYINKTATRILFDIDDYKARIETCSPVVIVNLLKERGRIASDILVDELNKEFWIAFSEFIIGILVILDIDENQDNFIITMYDRFHFVYSEAEFDVYEARDKLDINLIKGMNKGSKLVVGGLNHSCAYNGNVLRPENIVPNISSAELYNERDISRSNRRLLNNMTIVNSNIFKDSVGKCVDDEKDSLDYYKNLLISKIG